jgi:Tfp pilus assembly protein PilO
MENFREKRLERQLKSQQSTSIVIGVILLLSILGNVFLFIRNSGLNNENEELIREKNQLITEVQTAEETNVQLASQVEDLNQQMEQVREGAATLEGQVATRDTRIANLRRQIAQSEEADGLRAEELEAAEQEIKKLENERQELLVELELINERLTGLRGQHEALTRQIEQVSYVTVYNIAVNHLRDRWLGRPVTMEVARRVNRTEVSFEIDGNIFVEPGLIDVHLLMIDANGNIVNPSEETFTNRETGETIPYTEHAEVEYDHQPVPVEFSIGYDDRLESGTFSMEVYLNGELRGRKQFELE